MKLNQFPQAIADAERQLLKANQALRAAQAELDQHTATIESQIAHDESLKNERERKAKQVELMQEDLYQQCFKELHYMQDNRIACEIELSLLRHRLTVAKLEARERIATLENASA